MNLKLEKLLTAGFAAALGASVLATNPADARNGWMKVDCNYRKVISRGYTFVEYKTNGQHFNSTSMADCQQWRGKATSIRGKAYQEDWQELLPGSQLVKPRWRWFAVNPLSGSLMPIESG